MMEQGREPHLLVLLRYFPPTYKPFDPLSRLCVRHWLDCSVFSLASGLSSTTSAGGLPPLFGCFVGTTPLYDSPGASARPPCMKDLPLIAFSLRPAYCSRATTGSLGSRAWNFYACLG